MIESFHVNTVVTFLLELRLGRENLTLERVVFYVSNVENTLNVPYAFSVTKKFHSGLKPYKREKCGKATFVD